MDRHSFAAAPRRKPESGPTGFRLAEPISEPPQKRRYIKWGSMGDAEFLEAAQRIVDEKGIRSMNHMKKTDNSMFRAVKERGLEGKVRFVNGSPHAGLEAAPKTNVASKNGKGADGRVIEAKEPEPCKAPVAVLCREDARELAQLVIDEGSLASFEELAFLEPEISQAAQSAGAVPDLVFAVPRAPPERTCDAPGEDRPQPGSNARQTSESEMYRMILSECFRIGGANPFMGNRRGTIPVLQANLNRRLSGPEHKLFRKCWDRMAAEGAIAFNTNRTAASLDVRSSPRTPELREALEWAARQPERARLIAESR